MTDPKSETTLKESRKIDAYRAAAEMEKLSEGPRVVEPADDERPEPVSEGLETSETESRDLATHLEAAQNEAKENYDRFLRTVAEFDNYKKRATREAEEFRKFANESLLRELLTVVDSLERALEVPGGAQNEFGLRQGIELTLKQMQKFLQRFVVVPIEAEGQPFDPTLHQAMMQAPSDQVPENTVLRQMQKGYTLHDRLLRPAMVVVAKAADGGGDASPAEDTA